MWGSGSGTTSYSENIGAIGITKVMQFYAVVYTVKVYVNWKYLHVIRFDFIVHIPQI